MLSRMRIISPIRKRLSWRAAGGWLELLLLKEVVYDTCIPQACDMCSASLNNSSICKQEYAVGVHPKLLSDLDGTSLVWKQMKVSWLVRSTEEIKVSRLVRWTEEISVLITEVDRWNYCVLLVRSTEEIKVSWLVRRTDIRGWKAHKHIIGSICLLRWSLSWFHGVFIRRIHYTSFVVNQLYWHILHWSHPRKSHWLINDSICIVIWWFLGVNTLLFNRLIVHTSAHLHWLHSRKYWL